jgi:hypothetical protein
MTHKHSPRGPHGHHSRRHAPHARVDREAHRRRLLDRHNARRCLQARCMVGAVTADAVSSRRTIAQAFQSPGARLTGALNCPLPAQLPGLQPLPHCVFALPFEPIADCPCRVRCGEGASRGKFRLAPRCPALRPFDAQLRYGGHPGPRRRGPGASCHDRAVTRARPRPDAGRRPRAGAAPLRHRVAEARRTGVRPARRDCPGRRHPGPVLGSPRARVALTLGSVTLP